MHRLSSYRQIDTSYKIKMSIGWISINGCLAKSIFEKLTTIKPVVYLTFNGILYNLSVIIMNLKRNSYIKYN